jgi:hypothetical protein
MSNSRTFYVAIVATAAVGIAAAAYWYFTGTDNNKKSHEDKEAEPRNVQSSSSVKQPEQKQQQQQQQQQVSKPETHIPTKPSPQVSKNVENSPLKNKIPPGSKVCINGLKAKPELNGTYGTVKVFVASKQRYKIVLPSGSEVGLKVNNITLIDSFGMVKDDKTQEGHAKLVHEKAKAHVETQLREILKPRGSYSGGLPNQDEVLTEYLISLANGTQKEVGAADIQEEALKHGVVWMALNAGTKEYPGTEDRFSKVISEVVNAYKSSK